MGLELGHRSREVKRQAHVWPLHKIVVQEMRAEIPGGDENCDQGGAGQTGEMFATVSRRLFWPVKASETRHMEEADRAGL